MFFVCLGLVPSEVRAQETIHFAALSGRVSDPSDSAVPDAYVSARNVDTNQRLEARTDRDGRFRFPYLRAGRYEIRVTHPGFADVARSLTLTVGSAFDLPISLPLAEAATNITVIGDATTLEAGRSQVAGTISQTELNQLPLAGRSFLDAALLIPGVSPTNTGSNQLFAETAAVPGQGLSIGSQRNFSNSYIVDGLSDNDDASGLPGTVYTLEAVQELQVVTSGGQAEFGRALGGYVNVVTRSGANAARGDLYGYFRNSRFNSANPLARMTLPMTQAQYGASLSGPLSRDRTFYFGNFEQRALNQSGLTTISPANVGAINSFLESKGYPGRRVSTGIYPNPVHGANLLLKSDHRWSDRDQLSARYSLYRVDSINSRGAGGLSAPSASADLSDTDHIAALSNVFTLSPRAVHESRGQFWISRLTAPPSDPVGPAVSIAGVASFGTLSGSPTARDNKLVQVVHNFSYQAGLHALRTGAELIINHNTIVYPRSYRGSYSFASLAAFLSGAYNNSGFTQTFANSAVTQVNPNQGFYAQDEWKVAPNLTLNIGVRYDLQFLETIATDTDNLSPRAGFGWTPFRSGRTVIRGGYGVFYDRVPLRALANALLSARNTVDPARLSQISVSLSPAQPGAPVFPNVLGSLTIPSGVQFNFSTMDRRMPNAYSEQGSFEIERRTSSRSVVSAGYQHLRGLHLILSVNQNVPACVAAGANNGCRPNPNYANNSQYSGRGNSVYDAIYLTVLHRPARWGDFRVSYTYSKAMDDVGEFFFSSPMNNYDIRQDWGRSDDDQRHRIALDGSVRTSAFPSTRIWQRLTHGWRLSGVFQYYSALPFNITTGTQTVQGTAARPVVNGAYLARNAGIGFDFLNLSARLSRTFRLSERLKLEALTEGFNITNHVNGVSRNGTFGTGAYPANPLPAFNATTAVGDARQFQFALRVSF